MYLLSVINCQYFKILFPSQCEAATGLAPGPMDARKSIHARKWGPGAASRPPGCFGIQGLKRFRSNGFRQSDMDVPEGIAATPWGRRTQPSWWRRLVRPVPANGFRHDGFGCAPEGITATSWCRRTQPSWWATTRLDLRLKEKVGKHIPRTGLTRKKRWRYKKKERRSWGKSGLKLSEGRGRMVRKWEKRKALIKQFHTRQKKKFQNDKRNSQIYIKKNHFPKKKKIVRHEPMEWNSPGWRTYGMTRDGPIWRDFLLDGGLGGIEVGCRLFPPAGPYRKSPGSPGSQAERESDRPSPEEGVGSGWIAGIRRRSGAVGRMPMRWYRRLDIATLSLMQNSREWWANWSYSDLSRSIVWHTFWESRYGAASFGRWKWVCDVGGDAHGRREPGEGTEVSSQYKYRQ